MGVLDYREYSKKELKEIIVIQEEEYYALLDENLSLKESLEELERVRKSLEKFVRML